MRWGGPGQQPRSQATALLNSSPLKRRPGTCRPRQGGETCETPQRDWYSTLPLPCKNTRYLGGSKKKLKEVSL